MNKGRCVVLFVLLAFALVGASLGWGQATKSLSPIPAPQLLSITAKISSPGKVSAICPYTLKFKGAITASAACAVTYKIIRSDGGVSIPQILHFAAAGTQAVDYTWTLGATLVGWVAIQVTSPASVTSNHGDFALVCVAKAAISKAQLKCGGEPCNEMDIAGTGFGASQGARQLVIDGTVITNILNWSDTSISIGITQFTLVYWDHVYQFSLKENGNTISNIYSQRMPVMFDSVTPTSAAPGTVITLNTWGGGSQADGRVVKIGNNVCQVVSWMTSGVNADIKVKVPAAPAGPTKIYIQRGADIISQQFNFTIL